MSKKKFILFIVIASLFAAISFKIKKYLRLKEENIDEEENLEEKIEVASDELKSEKVLNILERYGIKGKSVSENEISLEIKEKEALKIISNNFDKIQNEMISTFGNAVGLACTDGKIMKIV